MSEPDVARLVAEIAAKTDAAIDLARQRLASEPVAWRRLCYEKLATNLVSYKSALLDGRLPIPGNGLGWGACKALSEWGLEDDAMRAAVEAAEGLYRDGG